MDLTTLGTEILVDLDIEYDAAGLHAVMSNNPGSVSQEVFERGQYIYAWLYNEIARIAGDYRQATAVPFKKRKLRQKAKGK